MQIITGVRRRRAVVLVGLALAGLAVPPARAISSGALVGSDAAPASSATPASPVTITVDAAQVGQPISRLLFGLNHRWAFDAFHSYDPEAGRVAPNLTQEMKQARISWVRYPAGTMGNLFHWKDAIGPAGERHCQIDGANGFPRDSDYGPDEHERFVESIGATSSIVVNFATGTPLEAADWVEYMNAPVGTNANGGVAWADVRAANGHPQPYGVKWWEVGNEMAYSQYWMGPSAGFVGPVNTGAPGANQQNVAKYAFGGSGQFVNQNVGTDCDRRPAAALGDGRADQRKFVYYPPVASGQVIKVGAGVWREVDDLSSAGPSDAVYALKPNTGEIRFGDGAHGAIPAVGDQITITYDSGPHHGFVDFHQAMKAVDPSINVCASFDDHTFFVAMGSEHPYDCVVAHPYLLYPTMPTPEAAHDFVMAGADQRATYVEHLQDDARAISGRDVRLALTEYGVLSARATAARQQDDSDYMKSLDHALYTAAQLIRFAQLGIPLAGRHTMIDFQKADPTVGVPSPPGFSVFGYAPSFTPSASAKVLELFGNMTGDHELSAAVGGNPEHVGPAGTYSALLTLASVDRAGRLSLIVVNRDPTQEVSAMIDVKGSRAAGPMQAWTVNGPSTTAFNTPEDANVVTLGKTTVPQAAAPFEWTFPAHSVTALRLLPKS